MCAAGRPERDAYGIRIAAGTYSDAYLQRADVQRGYTLVIWRGRHVAEPTELTDSEAQGYWLEVLRVARALQHQYQPLKLNYQVLGTLSLTCMRTCCRATRRTLPQVARSPCPSSRVASARCRKTS
jgi:hypothetical protein